METKHPEGVTVVKSTPLSPVMITRLRTVGFDKQTIEAQLEQMFEPPIGGTNAMLSYFMEGHEKFNSGARKRVAWQNMSTKKMVELGIISSWEQVGESKAEMFDSKGVSLGVKDGILIPQNLELKVFRAGVQTPIKLIVVDTFLPRTWKDQHTLEDRTQSPRRAGQNGDVLMRAGRPIYRNTTLSMPGNIDVNLKRDWDEDYIITHDNAIVGSTVRAAMSAAGMPLGQPATPQGAVQSQADPNLQNAGIGQTSNLIHGAPETTRSGPAEQTQDVADKTKAEENREAGLRSPVTEPQHEG